MTRAENRLFANRNFRLLWVGQTISVFGSQFSGLAFAVLAVSILGANEIEMGFLNASNTAGFLVVGLVAGAWVDRWRKRRVMLFADLVRMAALILATVLYFAGVLEMWNVICIALVVGVATVFFDIAYQSIIPLVVGVDDIGRANSRLEVSSQSAQLAGPSLAGILLSVVSAPVVFLLDALTFAVSATSLGRMSDTEEAKVRDERRPLKDEIAEGVKFVWNNRFIRSIAFTTASSNLFSTAIMTLLPLLILRDLGISAAGLGLLESFAAVGGGLGALLTTRLVARFGEGPMIASSALLSGLVMTLVPIATLNTGIVQYSIFALGFFLFGFAVLIYNITQVSARQRLCPPNLLGRMNASIKFLVWGVLPISAILSGLTAHAIGIVSTLWIGVVGCTLASLFVVLSPLAKLHEINSTKSVD